jgi:RNA-directed DNA polymerase
LHQSLKTKTYQPDRVKRTYILKPDGRKRPLGIPTIRDRIVQTAAAMILESIFEADFLDTSYGFRPERSAWQARQAIQGHLTLTQWKRSPTIFGEEVSEPTARR